MKVHHVRVDTPGKQGDVWGSVDTPGNKRDSLVIMDTLGDLER